MTRLEELETELEALHMKQKSILEQQRNCSKDSDNDFLASEQVDLARESFKIMDRIAWEKYGKNFQKESVG
jgi:hypothetical protein